MPIYSFDCPQCGVVKDELRKLEDYAPPICSCGRQMERLFTPITAVLKGAGWSQGQWAKLNNRSQEQNKKFFRRHPQFKEMADHKIQEKRTLEGG
jgi:putative FmdB family regulatory protein